MRWISALTWVILSALFLTSCQSKDNTPIRFGRFYLDKLVEQRVSERNFLEISYEKSFSIPITNDLFLHNPQEVVVDDQGYIYILDSGIQKILRFSPSGEYLVTYGEEGGGEGPGELQGVVDFFVAGDSMIYILDTYGFKISIFGIDGIFLKDVRINSQPFRYTRTTTGREYILYATTNQSSLLESRFEGTAHEMIPFSSLVDAGTMDGLGTSGNLNTYGENLIYVLSRYPLLFQYDPSGSLVYARTTIEYNDDFEEPEIEERILGGMPAKRQVGRYFHADRLIVEDDKLFIFSRRPRGAPDTSKYGAIDVYDIATGDYQYSMSIPEDGPFVTTYQSGKIYQLKDTTVVVWNIKK